MQIPAFNANTIIIVLLFVMTAYGALIGKQRLRILILSVYVGIVLAEQLGSVVSSWLPMLNTIQISGLLLGAPIVIFGLAGIAHQKNHDKGALIANLLVGLIAGALIISSALRLLPPSDLAIINDQSFLAVLLQRYHLWILGLLPVAALLLGFMKHHGRGGH